MKWELALFSSLAYKCSDEHFLKMSITPEAIRKFLDELEASRASRKRAWENLQEIRWILKDATGVDLPAPARKTIDLEGRVIKEGVRKIVVQSAKRRAPARSRMEHRYVHS
jgi:hypothetical protein